MKSSMDIDRALMHFQLQQNKSKQKNEFYNWRICDWMSWLNVANLNKALSFIKSVEFFKLQKWIKYNEMLNISTNEQMNRCWNKTQTKNHEIIKSNRSALFLSLLLSLTFSISFFHFSHYCLHSMHLYLFLNWKKKAHTKYNGLEWKCVLLCFGLNYLLTIVKCIVDVWIKSNTSCRSQIQQ